MKTRIMFITGQMGNGGAERVYATLLNHLDSDKFQPILLLLDKARNKGSRYTDYISSVPDHVELVEVTSNKFSLHMLWLLIKTIRRKRPNIIFSNGLAMNMLLLVASFFINKSTKIIIKAGTTTSLAIKRSIKYKVVSYFVKLFRISRLDAVICVAKNVADDFLRCYKVSTNKIHIIGNPVDIQKISKLANYPKPLLNRSTYNIIGVGRLKRPKNFSALLRVFSQIQNKNTQLYLLGRGCEEEKLRKLAAELNISDRVSFLGFQSNPYAYMKQADLLALTSKYEGMPNVLLEANACGTPVVAFDCPGGVKEMIIDNVNGILVENQNEEKMVHAIEQAHRMQWDCHKVEESVLLRYNACKILAQYESVFQNMS